MTRFFAFLLSLIFLLPLSASASRTIFISGSFGNGYISSPSCDAVADFIRIKPSEATCYGGSLNRLVDGTSTGETMYLTAPTKFNRDMPFGASVSGTCKKDTAAGMYSFPMEYVDANENVLTKIHAVADLKFSVSGCMVQVESVITCGSSTRGQPSNLVICQFAFKETGALGDWAMPDTTAPPYVPPTPGTTPGTGGGTDPGTGGGTTPGTGGGTTPGTGGGGGTTPGTGGGGTTPGTGGGGTTPGTGGGNGDGGAKCGAPGQPACSIDEGKTPTGIGGMLDALNKLVDGIGSGRDEGLHLATDDANKDTSLSFGLSLPAGACTDPSVSLPGGGGSWRVDICSYVAMIAPMFEYLWTFLFVYAVMAMVSRATAKPIA